MRRAAFAVVAVVLAGAGAAATAANGSPESATVRGAVFLGPLCGNLPAGGDRRTPCRENYRPLRARIRFVRTDRKSRTRTVRSSRDGRFDVRLAPGRYRVEPLAAPGSSGAPGPRTVVLAAGEVEDLIVDYSTGEN